VLGSAGAQRALTPGSSVAAALHSASDGKQTRVVFASTVGAVDHEREAKEIEAVVAQTDPDHEPDDVMALYAVSKHHRGIARAADLATAPGAIGWNARRAMRALLLPRNPDRTMGSSCR
jgi:hypothetical protein